MSQLGLSATALAATQTLVVLPLDDADTTTRDRVSRAIDEIQGDDGRSTDAPPAASFLFLPGIGRMHVVDSVRCFRAELERKDTCPKEDIGEGVMLHRQQTSRKRFDLTKPGSMPVVRSQEWWVVKRNIGGCHHGDNVRAAMERQDLREAIQALRLPGELEGCGAGPSRDCPA